MKLSFEIIDGFKGYLIDGGKSGYTVEKYVRDVLKFRGFVDDEEIEKETAGEYRDYLLREGYCVRSVNSMLSSVNALFDFLGRQDLKVKTIKMQRSVYCPEDKELTRAEYQRLCEAARRKKNNRLEVIIETVCATGIRIGELKYITVESAKRGEAVVTLKGKTRFVFIPKELKENCSDTHRSRILNQV